MNDKINSKSQRTTIAFLGLGAMGSRMVQHLTNDYDVVVWNRTRKDIEGTRWAASPADAAAQASIIISMVRDDEASSNVWLDHETGAVHTMREDAIAIECSTLSIKFIQSLNAQFKAQNKKLIEVPLAGSRPHAEAASLLFFCAGDKESVNAVEPVLATMGKKQFYIGQVGNAAAIKLAVNTMLATQLALSAELLSWLAKLGITSSQAVDILKEIPVCSPANAMAMESMQNRQFDPQFPIELVAKDLSYLLSSVQELSAQLPVSSKVNEVFENARELGLGDKNITGIALAYMN